MTKQTFKKSISKLVEGIMLTNGVSPDEHPKLWVDLASAFHRFMTEVEEGESPGDAKARVLKEEIDKVDVILQTIRAGSDREAYRKRAEAALVKSPNWDDVVWRDFDGWLMGKDAEGQTIEKFMEWFTSDEFRSKQNIWLNPSKIKEFWPLAFVKRPDEARPEYQPFTPKDNDLEYVPRPK